MEGRKARSTKGNPVQRTYYPLLMDLEGRLCIVVGGGKVAERKVRGLLSASASVRVISPKITKGLSKLQAEGKVAITMRAYRKGDLKGAALVVAATDSEDVHRKVREETAGLTIPLNVVDNPRLCDFIVPSVVKKGPILIAVSTSGSLPMLSKKLRQDLIERLSADYVTYAKQVGRFRALLMDQVKDAGERRKIMRHVASLPVADVARMTVKDMKEQFIGACVAPSPGQSPGSLPLIKSKGRKQKKPVGLRRPLSRAKPGEPPPHKK